MNPESPINVKKIVEKYLIMKNNDIDLALTNFIQILDNLFFKNE